MLKIILNLLWMRVGRLLNERIKDLTSHYKVFKEQFVVCWAGNPKKVKNEIYYSRVDIE